MGNLTLSRFEIIVQAAALLMTLFYAVVVLMNIFLTEKVDESQKPLMK